MEESVDIVIMTVTKMVDVEMTGDHECSEVNISVNEYQAALNRNLVRISSRSNIVHNHHGRNG